jgi:hypothetical protein
MIKGFLTQYMQKYSTKIWVPAISALLNNYNNRIHTTTKETPNSVFDSDSPSKIKEVKDNIKQSVKGTLNQNKKSNQPVKVGDSVRVLKSSIDPKLRAVQLSEIGSDAKKFKS